MNEELKIIIKAVTDSAKKGIKEVSGELEGLSKSAKGSSGKVGAAFKGIAKGAAVAVAAVAAITAALVTLGKNSLPIIREQAKLTTAFQAAGASAAQAAQSYTGLYRFLGDSGKATEAAAHLAKITTNQQNLAEWSKICQGIYASFGDSLPIEGLTEAANETLRVGKVTGTLADALNWAGVSEDEFNAKLATTNSLEEREAMLRSTLNGLYSDAAEIYERNNAALIEYNESQARLDTTMAAAGAATMPLLTALNNLGTAFFTALTPALNAIIPPIATFINWIAKAIQSVLSFFSALTGKSTVVKAFGEIGGAAGSAAKNLGAAADGAKSVGSGMGGAGKAAGGAAKAIEEVKRSTQGFDELNIMADNSKSAGGGSGGSGGGGGGGSAAPGYASGGGSGLLDTAAFGTEVEESEGLAHSLADKVKNVFGQLADVFSPSIKAWSGAFETVKNAWNKAKPDFIHGATEIKESFVTLGKYWLTDFIPNMVNSFSVNLAPAIGDTLGFIIEEYGKMFGWLGEYANTITNDVAIPSLERIKQTSIDTFEIMGAAWEEHGASLLSSFSGFFEKLRGHYDNFYNKVFKPIWDNVLKVFDRVWQNGLKPLVDKFVNAVMVISTELTTLYNKVIAPIVDWIITKILPPIVNAVNTIIKIVGDILISISNIVGGIIDVIKGIIQFVVGVFTGDWGKAWEGIKNIFKGFWEAIKGIIDLLLSVLKGICDFVIDVLAAAFKIAWEAIKLVWEQVVAFFKSVWDGIVNVFKVVGEWFKDVFTKAWEGIKNAWSGVTTWFSNLWTSITNVFSNVAGWFRDKFSAAWTAIKNVFSGWGSFFSSLWDNIKTTFSSLGTSIGNAISGAVKQGINGVISMIEKTINSAIGLINGAINLINKLPGVHVGKVGKLSLPRLAKGGIVDSATVAMIGEAGKEAVLPLENNTGWMDKLAEKIGGKNSAPTKVILKVGEKELGWATIDAINGITEQTGGLQLAL
jgi:hypothetical protein